MRTAVDFFETVSEIQSDIVTISDFSGDLGTVLDRAEDILDIPSQLEEQLRDAADALDFPDPLVSILQFLPFGIGTAIKTIDNVAETTSDRIDAQADVLAALDDSWEPAKQTVSQLQDVNAVLGTVSATADFTNAQVQEDALRIAISLGSQQIADGFELADKIDAYDATADIYFDVRDSLLAPIQAAEDALAAALESLADLLPDTSLLDDVTSVISTVFQPVVDAAQALEEALCVEFEVTPEIFIPGTPAIVVPPVIVFGVTIIPGFTIPAIPDVTIPAVVVDICEILETLSQQVAIVQNFVEGIINDVLNAIGIDFGSTADDLLDLLLTPLQPVFDAIEDLQDLAASVLGDITSALDPLVEDIADIIDALDNATSYASLFENTIEGDGDASNLDDVLTGTSEEDAIYGYSGNDILTASGGGDFLFGGGGNDQLISTGGDESYGGAGFDILTGSEFDDRMDGGGGGDILSGAGGNDLMIGGGGRDAMDGGTGEDWMDGGFGNDVMTGGADADTFVYNFGRDRITDFTDNEDTLAISSSLVAEGTTVQDVIDQAVSFFGNTYISFSQNNVLTLNGVTDASILEDDLIFV